MPFYHYEKLPTKSSLVIFFVLTSISPHINVATLNLLLLPYTCIFLPSFILTYLYLWIFSISFVDRNILGFFIFLSLPLSRAFSSFTFNMIIYIFGYICYLFCYLFSILSHFFFVPLLLHLLSFVLKTFWYHCNCPVDYFSCILWDFLLLLFALGIKIFIFNFHNSFKVSPDTISVAYR